MILSGLFFSILRCVGFHNCSRTTGTLRVAKTNTPCLEKNILAQNFSFGKSFVFNFFSLRPLRALRLGSGILFDFSSSIYVVDRFSKITVPRLRKNILAQKLLFGVPFILNFFTLRPLRALRLSSGFLARGVIRGKNSFNIGACNV